MNIKKVLIAGCLATMLAATGCSSQAVTREREAARGLTNSVNRAYNQTHRNTRNNTYGYGYDRYDNDNVMDGNHISDYADNYTNDHYYNGASRRSNAYNNGITGYSYDNSWNKGMVAGGVGDVE